MYPKYRLFVMVAAGLLVFATWLFLEKTRYGAIMRAGIENKEMVSLLGIDIKMLFTVAFALGAYLAGIAGALTAPIRGLNPAWARTCSASPSSSSRSAAWATCSARSRRD
jgi:branched-chain amino acid transport system permease protein